MEFDLQYNIRINEYNIRKIKELVEYYNKHEQMEDNDSEFNESQIIRIAINRLHREKFNNQKV
jgi:hypothetical protein